MLVCSSPCLIAAYHVLLRLSDPRHPPCALIRFKNFQIFKYLVVSLPPKVFFYSVFYLLLSNMSKNYPQTPKGGRGGLKIL